MSVYRIYIRTVVRKLQKYHLPEHGRIGGIDRD